MKLEDLFKTGKKFITCLSLVLLGFGSAYIVSCGDDGNGENGKNGDVNKAPIANAGPDQPEGFDIDCFDMEEYDLEGICESGYDISNNMHPGNEVTLDGSNSYDPEGSDLEYLWTKISGPTANLSNNTVAEPYFTPSIAGDYVFELEVSDGEKISEADYVSVFVRDNLVPVADAGFGVSAPAGIEVEFDASNSYDADGNIIWYNFDFGDGFTYTETPTDYPDGIFDGITTHTYLNPGNYTVRVDIKDDDGATDFDTAPAGIL